eukprot:g24180.t1
MAMMAKRCLATIQRSSVPFVRRIFDTPEYYSHIFSQLEQGEILEWYNVDWKDVGPILGRFIRPKTRRILDLGCGTSRLPAQLAEGGFARLVVGCDISPEALLHQKATAPPRSRGTRLVFTVADVKRLPFRDGCFDIVLETPS